MNNKVLSACLSFCVLICSCAPEEETGSKYGDLGIFFDADEFEVAAGHVVSIPFSVTGSEGATLKISGTVSDNSCSIKVKYNADFQGTVDLTAPAVTEEKVVEVTLTASDSHGRKEEGSVPVKLLASEPLVMEMLPGITSVAIKPSGSFDIPFKISGLSDATIASASVDVSAGWSGKVVFSDDNHSGKVTLVAPSSVSSTVSIKASIVDSYGRKTTLTKELPVVLITSTAGASNCYIVKPGASLAIKAVEGNSADTFNFDNAVLLWQDCLGMVKSVSGNAAEKIVMVELNSGKSGNAVVAAREGETIKWSWHIWVTDYDPMDNPFVWVSSATGKTYTFMDRNMGASTAEKYKPGALGLFYQWGRKDPFPGGSDLNSSVQMKMFDINANVVRMESVCRPKYGNDYSKTNLPLGIQNPMVFYYAESSDYPYVDWLTDKAELQDNDLWGGVTGRKTKYDPCPEGWTVPGAGDAWSFRANYIKEGSPTDMGLYHDDLPWWIGADDGLDRFGWRYRMDDGKEFWFPLNGHISCAEGVFQYAGASGFYHTNQTSNTLAFVEIMSYGDANTANPLNRSYGAAVRCIKE